MSHTDQVRAALAERMSTFPLIQGPGLCQCHAETHCPEAPWADPRVQDVLARAAHRAAARRFTGELPSAFGGLV